MEPFNEILPPLPLEIITEATLAADLLAWKTNPPDPDFALILEANPIQD
jgi:hypothetical protein